MAALIFSAAEPVLAVSVGGDAVDGVLATRIVDRLKEARPEFDYRDVKATPIPGIFEVQVVGGPILYVANEGEFFFDGDLYQVRSGAFVNLREQQAMEPRRKLIAAVPTREMIIFAPATATKAIVNVFTDVDCGYCRKLHQQVPEMNRLGIEVRYLGFPRAGVDSPAYRKYVSAWCAKDPRAALTTLKSGGAIAENLCANNPVAQQYELGQELGVKGTPALVLADGSLLPGYVTAAQLAKTLGISAE
ncbi:MAG: thioredoxin fold domain-containing protein [Porticoccaceae bacterium]